jgi:hypothetical protein
MSEQLIIELRYCIKYFELAAAITGLLFWKKWKHTEIRYLVIYLLIITLSEFTGNLLGRYNLYEAKGYLYKYFVLPFEFLFVTFFFFKISILPGKKKFFGGFTIIYVCAFIIERLFWDGIKLPFNSFSYSIGVVIFLSYIFSYLKNLVQSDELLDFYKLPSFWVVTGLFIFYLVSFPYYLLFNFLVKSYYKEIFLPYQVIVIFLNYIMYSIFIFNFIWTKPR